MNAVEKTEIRIQESRLKGLCGEKPCIPGLCFLVAKMGQLPWEAVIVSWLREFIETMC